MEAKAIAKSLRISPIKARLVVDLIRGKDVNVALNILNNMNKKPARLTKKVLDSAIANAVNNLKLERKKRLINLSYVVVVNKEEFNYGKKFEKRTLCIC